MAETINSAEKFLIFFCAIAVILSIAFACACSGDDDDSGDDGNYDLDDDLDDDMDDDLNDDTDDDLDDDLNDDIDDDFDDDLNDDINDAVGETEDPEIPLCQEWELNPDELDDPVNIHCLIERGRFAAAVTEVPDAIRVVDWNIERGHSIDEFITQFQSDPTLVAADIILIQEADRHCARTDYRNITRELAQALSMDYVYSVEFVELNQERGEHGNAILSRFPIGEAAMRRLPNFERWWEDDSELRLGGRMSIRAEIMVGDTPVQLCSTHFLSGVWRYFTAHQEQTQTTLDFLEPFVGASVWGGDLNTGVYYLLRTEPSINLVFDYGYADALADAPHQETWTHPADDPIPPMRLDWIFFRGLPGVQGRVLYDEHLSDLSDHLGVVADIFLD